MSKKKKRKTRKEKERAKLHREKYFDKYVKMNSNINTPPLDVRQNEKFPKTLSNTVKSAVSSETSLETQYIISDTKKSLIIALIFFAIIIIFYFLEQKFNYFGPLANKLITILLQNR